jgi:TolB-like protein/DNA-binding winged helix-turn-helix (wHTH) protein
MLRPALCRVFRFADFEADVHAGELRRYGVKVALQEQPFQVLAALLERPGELVWREDLRQRVWPQDTFVEFDHALNTAVKKIRIALGDCANSPCYIETIPKRGYRFVAAVAVAEEPGIADGELPADQPVAPVRSWRSSVVVRRSLAATVLLSVAFLGMRWRAARDPNAEHIAIAVLPLEDWSDDARHLSLCDGISEELITQLARVEPGRLTVAARASTLQYRHSTKTVAEVAHDLRANYLLEGNLRGEARHVRVTVELIRVRDEARVWGDDFDRETGDSLALETEVAEAITARLKSLLLAGASRER